MDWCRLPCCGWSLRLRCFRHADQKLLCSSKTRCAYVQLRRLSGEEKWKGRLQLRKRKDHFIFTVQSTGEQSSPSQPTVKSFCPPLVFIAGMPLR